MRFDKEYRFETDEGHARDGRIHANDRGMLDSQWVAQQIGRPVIKAFNNILATSLIE